MDGSAYESVRQMMPAAIWWTALALHALLAVGLPTLFAMLLLRSAAPSLREEWPERARLVFPYRRALAMILIIAPVGPLYTWWASPLVLSAWTTGILAALAYAAVLVLYARAAVFHDGPVPGFRASLRSSAFVWLIFFPWLVVALGLAIFLPGNLDSWVPYAVALVLFFLAASGGGFPIARALGVVKPAGPRLTAIIEELAERTRSPLRGVYEADSTMVNALVLPTLRRVIYTRRALEVLDDDEVAAIGAHEMSHLRESPVVTIARVAGLGFFVPLAFWRPVVHNYGWTGLLAGCVAGVAVLWLAQTVARRMERRADASAVDDGGNPVIYARALERLYRTNLMPAVMPGKGGIHGHLYDRMLAVGVEPAYERPPPPKGRSIAITSVFAMIAILVMPLYVPPQLNLVGDGWWRVALQTSDAHTFARLASEADDPGEALALMTVAAHEDWFGLRYVIRVAEMSLDLGDRDLAAEALREARSRLEGWAHDPGYGARIEELERRLE